MPRDVIANIGIIMACPINSEKSHDRIQLDDMAFCSGCQRREPRTEREMYINVTPMSVIISFERDASRRDSQYRYYGMSDQQWKATRSSSTWWYGILQWVLWNNANRREPHMKREIYINIRTWVIVSSVGCCRQWCLFAVVFPCVLFAISTYVVLWKRFVNFFEVIWVL